MDFIRQEINFCNFISKQGTLWTLGEVEDARKLDIGGGGSYH
jgi:hypothetical protein